MHVSASTDSLIFFQSGREEGPAPRDRSHIEDTLRLTGAEPSAEVSGEQRQASPRGQKGFSHLNATHKKWCYVTHTQTDMLLPFKRPKLCSRKKSSAMFTSSLSGEKVKQMCLHVNERKFETTFQEGAFFFFLFG